MLYGVCTADGPELMLMKYHDVIMPLASSEASHCITPAGRKYAHVNSSSPDQRSDTGLPAPLASRAASTATSCVCFPPKPPPKSFTITRTLSAEMRKAFASSCG